MSADRRKIVAVRRGRKVTLVLLIVLVSVLGLGPSLRAADFAQTQAAAVPTSESTASLSSTPVPLRAAVLMPGIGQVADAGEAVAPAQDLPAPAVRALFHTSELGIDDLSPPQLTFVPLPAPSAKPDPTTKPSREAREKPKTAAPKPTPKPRPEATPKPRPEATPQPKPEATPKPKPEPTTKTYSGTSHLWYPALGIDARWKWYGCEYGESPNGLGKGVYRWGCAPKKNVYLMSHASSTFRAVQRGYHSGAMKVGQKVWYADKKGNVSKWKVKWIKRVKFSYFIETFYEWASNASATPIMTLQTCDGRNDQYRIIVRLVPAR